MSDEQLLDQSYKTAQHATEQLKKLYDEASGRPIELPTENAVSIFRYIKQQLLIAVGATQELENRAIKKEAETKSKAA